MNSEDKETLVCALGGLGEVGKNMYVVMHEDELFIIDCGVMFPEDDLMGIDYVLADYTVLKNMQDKIKGLIITHGHEDHIGGIPFLLQNISIPTIYAPRVAEKLIKKKLSEKNIPCPNVVTVNEELNRQALLSYPVIGFVSISIIAPFVEEMIFRFGLRKITGNNIMFPIMSFLIFGFLHTVAGLDRSLLELVYIIPYGALGFVFAKAYQKSDNIFSSISAHMMHNTFCYVMTIIALGVL